MPVVMTMRWPGATPQQYDRVSELVDLEGDVPNGLVLHVASFADGALHVTDVWESREDFERYLADRLGAAIKEAGLEGAPETSYAPLHRRLIPPGVTGTT
ncbi:hypothetical protein [Streptacidiphilus anmyonensis]|uniref:hypothetical protein n=1 Tax=Streptacidiphilus anmyonensis TaxID=405782 RepID=UPI0005A70B7F|nr:hypothetical protein [Streptacidiphilus anmyonensis]